MEVEARFNDSVTRRSGLKERGFKLDVENPRVEYFQMVIESRGLADFLQAPEGRRHDCGSQIM